MKPVQIGDVFVAGGFPDVTYNPRSTRDFEDEVSNYLAQSGKALSISGPTKSGKTVLVERLVPRSESIWVQGSDLDSVESLWTLLIERFQEWETVKVTETTSTNLSGSGSGSVGIGIAKIGSSVSAATIKSTVSEGIRTRAKADLVRNALKSHPLSIVLDDFHFVPKEHRQGLARAIKTLIPLTHVILIAVPYDAFEAVRAEPDLVGRVWHLSIDPWSQDELAYISQMGFLALNLKDPDDKIGSRLAAESFGAPFLMQQLCYEVCRNSGVRETLALASKVVEPDWRPFLRKIARRLGTPIFGKLLSGVKTRGQERRDRKFVTGQVTDIYGAVLRGLQVLGPKSTTEYAELRKVVDEVLEAPSPTGQQIGQCAALMSEIAEQNRGAGDPSLVYKNDRVEIGDPYLLFFMRSGGWPDVPV